MFGYHICSTSSWNRDYLSCHYQNNNMMNETIISISRGGIGDDGDANSTSTDYIDNDIIVDYTHFVDGAYNWCVNLGAPSALVAGAVIASIHENINNNNCNYQIGDSKITIFKKNIVRWLLITSFSLEALSIFVTTVTSTMLLSQEIDILIHEDITRTAKTPLQLLQHHFELQYLAGYITFLQGILHWFLAISITHTIPLVGEKYPSTMNLFLSSVLFCTILFMLAIFNENLYFYKNYGAMVLRLLQLMVQQFTSWPPKRPFGLLLLPFMIWSWYLGIKVFIFTDYHNNNNDNNNHTNSSLQSSSSIISTDATTEQEIEKEQKHKTKKKKVK